MCTFDSFFKDLAYYLHNECVLYFYMHRFVFQLIKGDFHYFEKLAYLLSCTKINWYSTAGASVPHIPSHSYLTWPPLLNLVIRLYRGLISILLIQNTKAPASYHTSIQLYSLQFWLPTAPWGAYWIQILFENRFLHYSAKVPELQCLLMWILEKCKRWSTVYCFNASKMKQSNVVVENL